MRRQRNEALKREAEAKSTCDVSSWICTDQRKIAAPADFVGRAFVFDEMKKFLTGSNRRVLVIRGQPGRGKTAIIQRFLSEELPAGISPIVFYFRDQESQAEPQRWVRHLYASVVKLCELPAPRPSILDAKPEDLVQHLRDRIEEAAKKHPEQRLLLMIDAIDEAGSAQKLVWSFLTGEFPNTVHVVAATRSTHRSLSPNLSDRRSTIQPLDLDSPDYWNSHQADGQDWVTAKMPDLASSTIEKVVELSDANFLMLQGICRELREAAVPEVALREISELKTLGHDLQTALYERTWKRLERLPADELDCVANLATLLACAPAELSERTILDTLKLRPAYWVHIQQHFAEYLDRSLRYPPFDDEPRESSEGPGLVENSNGVAVFRLFHQTLVEFVRQDLADDLVEANSRLADYCREQIGKRKVSYEYAYALRFGPLHLCKAGRWSDLKRLLTDLKFVEEKCKRGRVYDLVADFDLARRSDPDWLQAIENESRRQKTLDNWAAGVMACGTRWGAELRRAWQQADPELKEPTRPFQFPEPPDTSDLCNLIRGMRWDELWDAKFWPESVSQLDSWRTFLTQYAGTLAKHPEALFQCVANSSIGSKIREQAEKVLANREICWLEERPRVGLDVGALPLPTIGVKATAFAISADGRRAATGEENGDVRLWDLVSGKCLCYWADIHPDAISHVLLTVDGSRVVTASKRGLILVHDCTNSRRIWPAEVEIVEAEWDAVDLSCSPEGSVVAVACSDGRIRVLDVEGRRGEYEYELSNPSFETLAWVKIWPEPFCVLAGDGHRSSVWDLITGQKLVRWPSGMKETLHVLKPTKSSSDEGPILIGFGQFVSFNVDGRSADGRIAVLGDGIEVEGETLHGFEDVGLPAVWYSHAENRQVIADGRVVWSRGESDIRGMDLLAYERIEELKVRPPQRGFGVRDKEFYRDKSPFEYHLALLPQELLDFFDGLNGADGLDRRDEVDGIATNRTSIYTQLVKEHPYTPDQAIVAITVFDTLAYTPDLRIALDDKIHGHVGNILLHQIDIPEGESIDLIQVSPCGQRAFVSLTSSWFIWDIVRGTKKSAGVHNNSKLSVVLPDWKCVASIDDGKLVIVDLLNGAELRRGELDTNVTGTQREIRITADGRSFVVVGTVGLSVWDVSQLRFIPKFNVPGATAPIISPDAKLMVCFLGQAVEIYDLATGKKLLSQPCRNEPSLWDRAWIEPDGTIVGTRGRETNTWQMTLRNSAELSQLEPSVTCTRVFIYDPDAAAHQKAVHEGKQLPGQDDDSHLTAVCGHCGKRFVVPESAETAIDEIIVSAQIAHDKYPCLQFPNAVWDEPQLRIKCTQCDWPLRLNPFVAYLREGRP
ncbi:MAG: NACHT domain-containing protein [Planctomycetaceae bacterium]|nr:NACHT domain-containing protein [Planctomycetaceae bacterium]